MTTFIWGSLRVSDVQSIILMVGSKAGMVLDEPRVLHLDPKVTRRRFSSALDKA